MQGQAAERVVNVAQVERPVGLVQGHHRTIARHHYDVVIVEQWFLTFLELLNTFINMHKESLNLMC